MLYRHDSVEDYVDSLDFTNPRNKWESRRHAQVLDALRKDNVPLAIEMLARNVAGIVAADTYNEPGLIQKFEWAPPRNIVPRDELRRALKDLERDSKLNKKKAKPTKPKKSTEEPAASKKAAGGKG